MDGDSVASDTRLLTCWKDIANYLGKGVRTVQRWERDFGLPVRRPNGVHHKSAVIAHASDLDAWMGSQWSLRKIEEKDIGQAQVTMGDLIKTSQELRSAHMTLLSETSSALQRLIESCNQLEETRGAARAWKVDQPRITLLQEALGSTTSSQYES